MYCILWVSERVCWGTNKIKIVQKRSLAVKGMKEERNFLYRHNKNLFSRQFTKILKVNFNFHCRDHCHLHYNFFFPSCHHCVNATMLCVSLERAENAKNFTDGYQVKIFFLCLRHTQQNCNILTSFYLPFPLTFSCLFVCLLLLTVAAVCITYNNHNFLCI